MKQKQVLRGIIYGLILIGCSQFPLTKFSSFNDYLFFIFIYGNVGFYFPYLNVPVQYPAVFGQTTLLTAIGLLIRYCLDYGAILNTMKYTWFNVITYMTIPPLFVTLFCYYISLKLSLPMDPAKRQH